MRQDFESFFKRATGGEPYGYLARIARDGLPDLVSAPTGTGKTGVILAWLWRRLHGPDPVGTPHHYPTQAAGQRRVTKLAGSPGHALPVRVVTGDTAIRARALLSLVLPGQHPNRATSTPRPQPESRR